MAMAGSPRAERRRAILSEPRRCIGFRGRMRRGSAAPGVSTRWASSWWRRRTSRVNRFKTNLRTVVAISGVGSDCWQAQGVRIDGKANTAIPGRGVSRTGSHFVHRGDRNSDQHKCRNRRLSPVLNAICLTFTPVEDRIILSRL